MIYWHTPKGEEYRVKLMLRYHIALSHETCRAERAELEDRIQRLERQVGFRPFISVDLEA